MMPNSKTQEWLPWTLPGTGPSLLNVALQLARADLGSFIELGAVKGATLAIGISQLSGSIRRF